MTARRSLHLAYAAMGCTSAGLPAVLPAALRDLGEGALLAAPLIFIGVLGGVLVAAPAAVRWRPNGVLSAGCLLEAAGILMAATAPSAPMFAAGALVAGLGFGLAESSGSIVAKILATGTVSRSLTALTTTVAIAAMLTPLVVLGSGQLGYPRAALVLVAALNAVAMVVALGIPTASGSRASRHRARVTRGLVISALALVIYVGVESVIAGWSATIPALLISALESFAALGTSAFWMLMAIGRALAGVALARGIRVRQVLFGAPAVAAVLLATASLTATAHPSVALTALGLCVVALAPMYGLLLGTALEHIPASHAAPTATLLVAAGALGGASLPLTIVWLGLSPASPAAFLTLAAGALCLLCKACVPVQGLRSERKE